MNAIQRTAILLAFALPGTLAVSSAQAQDFAVYGGAALYYSVEPDGPGSDNTVTVEPYVEVELNGFYAGLLASVANESVNNEIDLYLGYRNETEGGLSYDVGYTRYFYPNDGGNCCGEITLALDVSPTDTLTLSIDAALDPEAGYGATSLGAEYYVTDAISIAADVGVTGIGRESEWDVGANYYFADSAYASLYYYEGSEYEGYFELSVSYDTTLFSR